MKLELKHLAPYLPYRLKYIDKDTHELTTMRSISTEINMVDFGWGNAHELHEFKPILRPLSDLTKDEYFRLSGKDKHQDFAFYYVPKNYIQEEGIYNESYSSRRIDLTDIKTLPHYKFQFLVEHHFDVFGLINAGLAIDINTVEI